VITRLILVSSRLVSTSLLTGATQTAGTAVIVVLHNHYNTPPPQLSVLAFACKQPTQRE
jgi:hypothetical protein